ncbi:MAG: cation diffusion facilitator family transporter, partial [Fermentimonas sp.]|nr:cation diffusion facilitator family transporter [Fermentimonas sp.]
DVLGWVAVLIGAGVMYFVDAPIIDPILSIAIALFILVNVYRNMRESLRIILQGSPSRLNLKDVENVILGFSEVSSVHDLHAWSVDGEYNVLTFHVVLKKELSMSDQHQLKAIIRESLFIIDAHHCTIEFELPDEDCIMEDCK